MTKEKSQRQTINPVAGDVLLVPLSKEYHTYARFLKEGSLAFYDCKTKNSNQKECQDVIKNAMLFIARVNYAWRDEWTLICNVPLEERMDFVPSYFNPSPSNRENLDFYLANKAEIEELIRKDWISQGKLHLHGIHSPNHIRDRINCYYNHEPYKFNVGALKLFKNILNLP